MRFNKIVRFVLLFVCIWGCSNSSYKKDVNSAASFPEQHAPRLEWWQQARFGLFIHYGPVSLSGKEIGWSRGSSIPVDQYDNLYKDFNPVLYNADEWVSVAKAAGMKYIVYTSKHHDGFCNWDTQYTDYNIMNSPFKRDLMAELAEACKKQGMALGFYHSTCDWRHPDFPLTSPGGTVVREVFNLDRYTEYLKNQSVEIIKKYGPLLVMWYDVPQRFDSIRGKSVINSIREVDPGIVVNNRTGAKGDFDTPEQRVGSYQDKRPWETCMTICQQWSWKPNDNMKSAADVIRILVRTVGGDGNLLLNVGPMPDGRIEPRQVEVLKQVGAWLQKNGESIYGTRGGPWKPNSTLTSTRKGSKVYLHLLQYNIGELWLSDPGCKVKSTSFIGGGQVRFEQLDGKLHLTFDQALLDPMSSTICLELDGSAMDLPAISIGDSFVATASNVYNGMTDSYGPQMAFDNDSQTRWATNSGTKQAWLAVDLGKEYPVQRVRIDEAYAYRVQKFEFQYRSGQEWKTIFTGQKIGMGFEQTFAPVVAREFRLNVLDATDGPTIIELNLGI